MSSGWFCAGKIGDGGHSDSWADPVAWLGGRFAETCGRWAKRAGSQAVIDRSQ